VRLVASPELQLEQRGELLRLRGRVQVPRAEVRLDRFEGSQQVSSDVVVLDPAQPERAVAAAQRIDADVRLALGEDVELEGFGLNGRVSGELRVRDRPGRTTNASGSLNVSGRYKAYGQDLDITRGRLSFAQSPLDNPGLDIRAERRIDEVTVGIRVTGTAAAPVLGLWSQPSLDQADVLSYLMLGRPVRAVRSGEGQQLNAAAAALGAGGNFIAERLGARLGFDQASVEDSAALGGSALMLGKYLSPRLYVAYGVALFGDGQVFSIKYLLTEQWDLQVEASQRETRGSVNYRLER
jgi:translocation and assembly module TamB